MVRIVRRIWKKYNLFWAINGGKSSTGTQKKARLGKLEKKNREAVKEEKGTDRKDS